MEAITNSNPEPAAVAAPAANVPAQAAQDSNPQSSFTDCLERALQVQFPAAQQAGSGTVTSSANSQSSSANDCSLTPGNSLSATQNASQKSTAGCVSTLTAKTGVGAASRNSKQGPSQKQSSDATAAAGVTDSNPPAVPVQEPILAIAANVAAVAPFLPALPMPATVAPEPATGPVIARALVAAESGGLSPVLTTNDLVAAPDSSPSFSATPISSKPAALNQGSANSQPGTPVVAGSIIASMMTQALTPSAMPTIPAAAPNSSPSNQAPMPGQTTSERPAANDTGTSPNLNPSLSSPAVAPPAEKIIGTNDVASGQARGTIEPNSSDSKGAPKHQDKSGNGSQTIENSTQTVPWAGANRAGVDEAGVAKTEEPQTPGAFIHALEKQVASNAPQSSTAIGNDPSLQPASHAEKTGGDSAPSLSREFLHVHGLETASVQKSNANSDLNGGSSNTSSGQSSAAVPPPAAHGIAPATETSFSSHIDSALNSVAVKQEGISTASNSLGTPAPSGSTAAATGSAVTDRRDAEVASAGPAWDMVSAHAERLVQSAQLSQNAGQAEMRIHLSTEAMGSVELRTTVQQDHIAAAITVQRSETQAALLGELPSLQQSLQNRQLQIDRLDINYGGPNSGMSGQHESHSQNGGSERPQNASRNWAYADPETVRPENRADLESGPDGSRTLSVRA